MALAALKCTETVMAEHQGRQLSCVRGIPLGRTEPTVLYPGEIPDDYRLWTAMVSASSTSWNSGRRHWPDGMGGPAPSLDQALEFLIGDFLWS